MTSLVQTFPITWSVQALKCTCGGEFVFKFAQNHSDTPYTHVCDRCSGIENTADKYPRTTWEVA